MDAKEKSPLYRKIAEEIAERIKQGFYKGGYIPCESEISKEFGASRITVRGGMKMLEEAGLVEAIPGKGRRITGSVPASLAPRRPGGSRKLRISCAVQDSKYQSYQVVVNLINNMALDDEAKLSVHFIGDGYDHSSFERMMNPGESDGLICIGIGDAGLLARIETCGVPSVHIGSSPMTRNSVATDDFAGGYIAGSHLASHGHSELILLRYPQFEESFGFKARELGLVSALRERFGGAFRVDTVDLTPGPESLVKALTAKGRPKGLFMITDTLTPQLFTALKETGLKIPRDLSVTGFDNMLNTPAEWKRDIDSIDQPWTEIGIQAYQLIRQLMALGGSERGPGRRLLLRPKLVIKGTVADRS